MTNWLFIFRRVTHLNSALRNDFSLGKISFQCNTIANCRSHNWKPTRTFPHPLREINVSKFFRKQRRHRSCDNSEAAKERHKTESTEHVIKHLWAQSTFILFDSSGRPSASARRAGKNEENIRGRVQRTWTNATEPTPEGPLLPSYRLLF